MICPLTVVSCKARKLRIVIFQKGVVEMQRMYRILGNRWRIKRTGLWSAGGMMAAGGVRLSRNNAYAGEPIIAE
jgi:glycerol-3-phosphate dehydrogenase